MKKSKEEAPKPEAPKTEVRDKRDAVRDKARGKRAALRGAATAASCLMMAALLGCATATPASKAQTSKACGNTITVNLNLWPGTNALACAACPGGVTITLSDLIGTQVQSADAGGNESVNQTATPTNTSGVTGDKPIETIGDVGKTALTGGTSTVLKQAANAAGLTGTTANVEKAATATGSACADGSCAVPPTK
ncbi:MAG TPA: hypothetical protein PLG22_12990 [Kiritimatiellia bacterium]|nr:hypothetical protein [Kiritimatiellia bacterium]